eukprot:PhM_4_TR16528/c1_g1_i1/m.40432
MFIHDACGITHAASSGHLRIAVALGPEFNVWDVALGASGEAPAAVCRLLLQCELGIHSIAYIQKANAFACGGCTAQSRETLFILDAQTLEEVQSDLVGCGEGHGVTAMATGRSGRLLCTSDGTGLVTVFTTSPPDGTLSSRHAIEMAFQFRVQGGAPNKLAVTPDGRYVIALGANAVTCHALNTRYHAVERSITSRRSNVVDMALDSRGTHLHLVTTAGTMETIRLVGLRAPCSPGAVRNLGHFGAQLVRAVYTPDGNSIVSLGTDNVIRRWSTATHRLEDAATCPFGELVQCTNYLATVNTGSAVIVRLVQGLKVVAQKGTRASVVIKSRGRRISLSYTDEDTAVPMEEMDLSSHYPSTADVQDGRDTAPGGDDTVVMSVCGSLAIHRKGVGVVGVLGRVPCLTVFVSSSGDAVPTLLKRFEEQLRL